MGNLVLYVVTVLIWGSTWIVIPFQLTHVAPELSVAYRFALAAALLVAWCAWRRDKMRFPLKEHGFMELLGASLFSFNYLPFYMASQHLTSGLVAVVFSTVIVMNIFNNWLFRRERPEGKTVLAALVGVSGICVVFVDEITAFDLGRGGSLGLILSLLGTAVASCGNIIAARNQRAGLPVMQMNAYGMAYGAVFQFMFAMVTGVTFTIDTSFSYLASLLYLAVFGSIVAFWCYLTLIGRIGPGRAAYAAVMFPIVALTLSTVFEGFVWTDTAMIGVALISLGNILVLLPSRQ